MSNFETRLKKELAEQNILGRSLAEKCGVTESSVSKWLNGESIPRPNKIKQIAEILHVSVDYLLGKDEEVSSTQYHLPNSIDSVEEAKSFLKSLNLYNFSDISLSSKSDKEILEFARALYYILKMNI